MTFSIFVTVAVFLFGILQFHWGDYVWFGIDMFLSGMNFTIVLYKFIREGK